jgi:hypothetical protein
MTELMLSVAIPALNEKRAAAHCMALFDSESPVNR